MAVTQAVADRKPIASIAVADSDGYYYYTIGSIRIYVGSGTPNAIVTAPKGSQYYEYGTGAIYINSDAGTTWASV